ncbi:hypothetical protein OBBRIDRAFT_741688, partial [Obba rivulosa]
LPEGEPHFKVSELSGLIHKHWLSMTPEERIDATKDKIQELAEQHEMHVHAPYNTLLSMFHDVCMTSILANRLPFQQLEALYVWTDIKVALFVVCGSSDQYNSLFTFATSDRVGDVNVLYRLVTCIFTLYIGHAAKANILKMYYKNFDTKITAQYSLVIEGWPLDKWGLIFCVYPDS